MLVDQDKCRGWRMCISGCPYKKIYYTWQSGKAEKCTFCYPARIEADRVLRDLRGPDPLPGRDAVRRRPDRAPRRRRGQREQDLYQSQLGRCPDRQERHDPDVFSLRIPAPPANLLTAGKEELVLALELLRWPCAPTSARSTVHGELTASCWPGSAWTTPPCRTCTASWPSPTTRTASWCRAATRKWSRTASTRRAAAASPSATAAGRRVRGLAVRQEAAGQRDLHRHAQVPQEAAAAA